MKTIARNDLKALLDSGKSPVLIDVSGEDDYNAAHLPGAKNVCVYEVQFPDRVKGIAPEQSSTVVVYGSSTCSLASTTAAEKLERAGYTDVVDYRGGLADWQSADYALERGPAAPPAVQPRMGRHQIDLEKSVVRWIGRNINGAHHGTLKLSEGWLEVAPGPVATGEFTIDMNSLADEDLKDATWNAILIAHLKSDDFFDVERFPTAKFHLRYITVNSAAHPGNVNADIDGTLTLKGVTNEIAFPATIEVQGDGGLSAEAHFDIDRTRWNVIYGSGKFYERLGKHLVHDHISLGLHIVTKG